VHIHYFSYTNNVRVVAEDMSNETDKPLIDEDIHLANSSFQKDDLNAWVEILQELTELQEQIRDL